MSQFKTSPKNGIFRNGFTIKIQKNPLYDELGSLFFGQTIVTQSQEAGMTKGYRLTAQINPVFMI